MRDLIRLVSSAGTGHFYTTDKNKRTTPDKLEIKKVDPVTRKHVNYKETHHTAGIVTSATPCPDKIEIKKFDPVVRKHVIYKEAKIK